MWTALHISPENSRILTKEKYKELLPNIRDFIKPFFESDKNSYHNIDHIDRVVSAVKKISPSEQVLTYERREIIIAALFHDVGYLTDPAHHEVLSAKMAEDYLKDQNVEIDSIDRIKELIISTRLNEEPINLAQKILKDADLSYLGTKEFFDISEELRKEQEALTGEIDTDEEWHKKNIEFLDRHQYYTESARMLYNKEKKKNIKRLRKKSMPKKESNKNDSPQRGIETMFRVALRNHNNLSQMADNKANIMLSVSTIMMSLLLTSMVPKVDSNPGMLWPTIITLIVCLVTMYYAIMATRPIVDKTLTYSRDLLHQNKTNLLFFGNFKNLDIEEYEWGIGEMMKDKELLYGALIKDLFYLGKVLSKKFEYLHMCYNVFMIGLFVSAASFIFALVL